MCRVLPEKVVGKGGPVFYTGRHGPVPGFFVNCNVSSGHAHKDSFLSGSVLLLGLSPLSSASQSPEERRGNKNLRNKEGGEQKMTLAIRPAHYKSSETVPVLARARGGQRTLEKDLRLLDVPVSPVSCVTSAELLNISEGAVLSS